MAETQKIKLADAQSKRQPRRARCARSPWRWPKISLQLSLPNIGDAFGVVTIIHRAARLQTIAEMRTTDTVIERDYNALLQMLKN